MVEGAAMCRMNGKRLASVTLLMLLSMTGSLACATGGGGGGGSGGGEQPTQVRRLVIALPAPASESNNPWRLENPRTPWYFAATHESLIGDDPDTGAFIPQLATEWSIEPDGSSVRLKLREGVPFHHNKGLFSAKDVVVTHAQHVADDSIHTHRTQYRKVAIEVVNDHEVVFREEKPNPELIAIISSRNVISMEPFSADDMEALGGNPDMTQRPPVGTGFYQFVERQQGVNFRVERVPYKHWRATPDFPEIEFRWINEVSTLQAGLLAGEIHMTQLPLDLQKQAMDKGMAVATAKVLARERNLLTEGVLLDKDYLQYKAQGTACGYAYCDSPLLDVRVRRALSKAIDRKALNNSFFGGRATEVHNAHLVPGEVYWNDEWDRNFQEEYGYDPAAAQKLLAEAGYGPDTPASVKIVGTAQSGVPQAQDMAEAIAGYWRKAGVDVELDMTDPATVNAQERSFASETKNRFEWQTSNVVETQAFRVHHYSLESPRGGFETPELDGLIRNQRGTVDPEEALKRLRPVGDLAYQLHLVVPLFWAPDDITYNPKVVASYVWSGVPLGTISHFERIKAAK